MASFDIGQPLNVEANQKQPGKPKSGFQKFLSKKAYLLAILGFAAFFILLIVYLYQHTGGSTAEKNEGYLYNKTYPFTKPVRYNGSITFRIGVITDLDKKSLNTEKKNTYKAYMKRGYLIFNPNNNYVNITWDQVNSEEPKQLTNGYNYMGRGVELSELIVFDGKLLTFDDKTGIVFEVVNQNQLVPWVVLADGDGSSSKGFKSEWSTVKDEKLYIGSHGKAMDNPDGSMGSKGMMYVKIVTPKGEITHVSWENEYNRIGAALNITWPGYVIHESGVWSDIHKRWFFLPRKCSKEAYETDRNDRLGCNYLISTDENIFNVKVIKLNTAPDRGYSSFKFIPESRDSVIVAIRTIEVGDTTATYVSVFTVHGEILMNDVKISDLKYEGLEFL